MIPLSVIESFASTSRLREHLSAPWLEGLNGLGDIYVSDGRILLCAAVAEVEGAGEYQRPELPEPPETIDYWDLFDRVDSEVPAMLEEEIEIEKKEVDCPQCEGAGMMECECPSCLAREHPCGACHGAKTIRVCMPRKVTVFGRVIASDLIDQIRVLPDVRFYQTADPKSVDPLLFRFGQTGQGIVQPLVQEESKPVSVSVSA